MKSLVRMMSIATAGPGPSPGEGRPPGTSGGTLPEGTGLLTALASTVALACTTEGIGVVGDIPLAISEPKGGGAS